METDLAGADVPTDRAGLRDGGVQGLWVRGETPKELVLSDGTRLDLAPADGGRVEWWRRDEVDGHAEPISVAAAERLAGEDFTSYVEVRTRAEAQWLREVAEWCAREARNLEDQLERA